MDHGFEHSGDAPFLTRAQDSNSFDFHALVALVHDGNDQLALDQRWLPLTASVEVLDVSSFFTLVNCWAAPGAAPDLPPLSPAAMLLIPSATAPFPFATKTSSSNLVPVRTTPTT
ncbi:MULTISPECIES: hypothetical protein [unclassified Variovorax]|uniref:hypothetical protein n=1 Tax=unclassified Variovorax TaxID=663243 RepID=UPI002575E44F|nr:MULTISPECIES: hypothetical protein [unclassified Variovorax]MDM0091668.1 hypothetical protein [Variovorax sp. J22G40]MDM0146025.1 hypothetical protein [Variovorax sp. J2P1-31]